LETPSKTNYSFPFAYFEEILSAFKIKGRSRTSETEREREREREKERRTKRKREETSRSGFVIGEF